MRRLPVIALLGLAACAGEADSGANFTDAGTNSDAGSMCGNAISWDPFDPEASPIAPIRVTVNTQGSPGVLSFTWSIQHDNATVPFTMESSSGDSIGFIAADPGPYYLTVEIGGASICPFASATINVAAPGASTNVYRLRTVPPLNSGAPPQEQIIQVKGGADIDRAITLDPGLDADGTVRNGNGGPGIPAYVRFTPPSAPGAFTELFTGSSGTYSTQLVGVTHDVLVIPTSTTLAPKLVQWTPTTTSLVVGPGTVVTGTVRNPAGTGLGGAKVQLMGNGTIPSTLATTAGDGTFSLRADFPTNAMITVKVTPPAASGLPRIETSAQFTLTQAMQINYAAGLQTCNLANTPVRRSTVDQPGAKVTVVGSLVAMAATVTAGAAANATGTVRIAASADGSGRLPSMLVPRASTLSAVVQLGPTDFAVDAIDTSACAALTIDAPPLVAAAGVVKQDATTPLDGIRIEATPIGVLALADAQTILTTSNASGAFSLSLAPGGRYDVRFVDPYARVAQREETNITAAGVPANAILPVALVISGKVSISSSTQPLPGTSIQLLCGQCTGVSAARPIAETATNSLSDYRIAVPDPGTM